MTKVASNVVFIEFYGKSYFPPGAWQKEPDLVHWSSYGLQCLALRDMKLGCWKGFVGVGKEHLAFNKTFVEMINEDWGLTLEVHGGIVLAGKLPSRYKEFNKNNWWIGFECAHAEDFIPLIKVDLSDPLMVQILSLQTYKDLKFVRKEVNELARQLSRIK